MIGVVVDVVDVCVVVVATVDVDVVSGAAVVSGSVVVWCVVVLWLVVWSAFVKRYSIIIFKVARYISVYVKRCRKFLL